MELYLDKRAVKQIRVSVAEAIEEGDLEALKDEIIEAMPEEGIEHLETTLGGDDLVDFLAEVLDEWSGDDVDELFDLLETHLGDNGIDLKYHSDVDGDGDDDDDDEEEDEEDELDGFAPESAGFDDDDL
ncbi:MAG: hypothetical protein AAGA56_24755 [Myxococcota bacterium]